MAKRGKKMSYEERLACVAQSNAGKSDHQIALETGWSPWVIRKWRRAYRKKGQKALAPKMGRPQVGALSTFSAEVRNEVERKRKDQPGWGPVTLLEELTILPAFFGRSLPSRARIAAFLKEKQLVRKYERHVELPQPGADPSTQPHDEWEMDAQGRQPVVGLGQVNVVNIVDIISRLKVESYPQLWQNGLKWQDYQLVLRMAFFLYGLPKRITLDHDCAFFDSCSRSPYPMRLHLWLIGLGIEVIFIDKRPPCEHAIIERGHQTMSAQTIKGQTWNSLPALWQGLDRRREFLNNVYPSRSLEYQAPLEAYPEAFHSGREYRPEWEEGCLDLNRVYSFLAQGRWFRETNLQGEFWLGQQRYNARRPCAHTVQEIVFDAQSLQFCAKTVGTERAQRFPAKGLTKPDLMGELPAFTRLPSYQLALPFSREDWRQIVLARMMGRGTTL